MSRHEASALPEPAEALQGRPAGIVSRSVAAVIDVVVVATTMLAGYVGVCAVLFVVHPRHFSFPAPSGWFTVGAAGIVAAVYLTVGWWIAGRTYGAAVMGLRVVARDHQDLSFLPALVRAVVCVVFPLGLAWCAFDRRARGVHDLLARSRVIYDWRHQDHQTAAAPDRASPVTGDAPSGLRPEPGIVGTAAVTDAPEHEAHPLHPTT